MKKKYTKAKVEIISLKTEAFICASPPKTQGKVTNPEQSEYSDHDLLPPPTGTAKAYDFDGVTDFPFDSIPPTKE